MPVVTINNVSFSEHAPASPMEQWQADAARVRRILQLESPTDAKYTTKDDKRKAAQAILGVSRLVTIGGGPGKCISRSSEGKAGGQLPDSHPWTNDNGLPYLYASSINNTDNLGTWTTDIDNFPEYVMARFEVTYSTRSYQLFTDTQVQSTWGPLSGYPDEGAYLLAGWSGTRYITKRVRPAAKMVMLRSGLVGLVTNNQPLAVPYALPQPCMTVEYVWHQVPDGGVPWKAIAAQLGTVNAVEAGAPSDNFDGFVSWTLLFTNVDPVMGRDSFGNIVWDVTYSFLYLPNTNASGTQMGHNAVLESVSGVVDYYQLATMQAGSPPTATGRTPFARTNFSNLFRPDQT